MTPLFAETDGKNALYLALAALVYFAMNKYQSWELSRRFERQLRPVEQKVTTAAVQAQTAATAATTTATATTRTLNSVEASLNGDGLGGRMAKLEGAVVDIRRELATIPQKAATCAVAAIEGRLRAIVTDELRRQRADGDARPPAGG